LKGLGLLLVAFLLYGILFWYPHHAIAEFNIRDPKDLANAENSYRATMAQILGGIAIGLGLYYTWRRIGIAEEDLKVTKEGQITDRFTRAVDQLGNDKLQIRLGGIYALERISKESKDDYWPIMEILTTYVRENSPIVDRNILIEEVENLNEESFDTKFKVLPDTQAIMTVIGRRKYSLGYGESNCIELSETHLRMINLKKANFEGADLSYSDLIAAHLEKADFKGANLNNVYLNWAYLEGANFEGVDFGGAELEGATFEGANLKGANFYGANLTKTEYLTNDQLSKVETLHAAKLDDYNLIPLKEKYPALFEMPRREEDEEDEEF